MGTLGSRIKELRLERKITGDELGKILGISKSTISLYEHNKSTPDDAIKKKNLFLLQCFFWLAYGVNPGKNNNSP